MGSHLLEILSSNGVDVHVTSRKNHVSSYHIHFIQGNALDDIFLFDVLKEKYDAIVDFMNYNTPSFKRRYQTLCKNTSQYIFLSSARVYANSSTPITENSPRLFDVSNDKSFLSTDDYALAKARQENLLFNSDYTNWTIIRPYITYSCNRLQLGDHEHESWLYRIYTGRMAVLSADVLERTTTFTYGYDVAYCIYKLIGNKKAFGQVFHITNNESLTWDEIREFYFQELSRLGFPCKLKIVSNSYYRNSYRLKYDRLYNRIFDNSKLYGVIGEYTFAPVKSSLSICLAEFLKKPVFDKIDQRLDAISDKMTGERANIYSLAKRGVIDMVVYYLYRYLPLVLADALVKNNIFKVFRYGISLFK